MTINHLVGEHRVWKYSMDLRSLGVRLTFEMPYGAKILSAQRQGDAGYICIWALVPMPAQRMQERTFFVMGTGHPIPAGSVEFIDTVQFGEGSLVLHVFEAL